MLSSGEFACENSIKSGKAKLVLIASDASENTKKKFVNSAKFYKVDVIVDSGLDKESLGKALGKGERSIIAVLDGGFAQKILKMIG